MISVEVDAAQLAEAQERLAYLRNGANRALARALNRTASKGKTLASREIRKQVRLSAADVRERLAGPANRFDCKATVNKLTAKISTAKRGLRLDNFLVSAPPTRAGKPVIGEEPRVQIKPGGPEKTIWSGWWVRAKNSGGYLIVVRNDVLRKLGMKEKITGNLKYSALSGPSLSQVFASVKDDLAGDLETVLADNLQHEMEWLIAKYPPPGDDGSGEEGA